MSYTKQYTYQEPGPSKQPGPLSSEHAGTISTSKVELALKRCCKTSLEYEYLVKGLESSLSDHLSNFRAVESLMQESYKNVHRNVQRADRVSKVQANHIKQQLGDLDDSLTELADTLPTIQTQVLDIKQAYDSGWDKAQELVTDLTWLNTDFYERWRMIIFSSSSPVSWRWKVYMRTVFVVSFVVCSWLLWIGLTGAYRAHRHRLVWGEKLMS
ncbi:hypothetical protein CPB83DRAFT_850918 [Crepidotus variabilis]|uniref:Uncharacterized protein n=1 Tax=Crepidotus variabilis TaxID=179855 RepID=A0A9P6JSD6_9AGAR|nr:hypothetical protein CPB83DRAFT_850918 [Crepidotus variabilis]